MDMNINILSDSEVQTLNETIEIAQNIVICCHKSPDGDALGSSLGWANFLTVCGKSPTIVVPDAYPDFLQWMPGANAIVRYDKHTEQATTLLQNADLVFCLDFNGSDRVDEMKDALEASPAKKVMIDHHLDPKMQTVLTVSHPNMSSTSELVFRIIWQLGKFDDMPKECAVNIYCGMMTDTGGFTYNSNSPEIYQLISLLLAKGIDKDKIYRNVFNTYSESRLRLTGYILYKKLDFYQDRRASIFTLTRSEMTRFNFIRGDAEGLVNMPLQVKGMRLSISLREDTERDVVRVSLRSVDDFPCNKMAEEFFNGGGHLNASGGELPFPLSEAVKTAERAIEAYAHLL